MAPRKQLEASFIEEFKKDWGVMSYKTLKGKYKVCMETQKIWAKMYSCTLPKPRVCDQNTSTIIMGVKVTPQSVMEKMTKPDLAGVDVQHIEELKACNDEFIKLINDADMPKREKDELLFNIAMKAIGIFVSQQPKSGKYIECMADYVRLKLYERKVTISDKEKTEIDSQTIKNLKKKHISEAMNTICAELSPGERRFFEYLVQVATKKVLDRKKKANEAMQQKALETSGQTNPETVVEPPVVNAGIVGS